MRRLTILASAALLALALVPIADAGAGTTTVRHVDGTVRVLEPADSVSNQTGVDRHWLARFQIRTVGTVVQFGYLEMYGIEGSNLGEIHQYAIDAVDYQRMPSGAPGAILRMEECVLVPQVGCASSDYEVSDGSPDTFLGSIGWVVESGNISIYATGGQNGQ